MNLNKYEQSVLIKLYRSIHEFLLEAKKISCPGIRKVREQIGLYSSYIKNLIDLGTKNKNCLDDNQNISDVMIFVSYIIRYYRNENMSQLLCNILIILYSDTFACYVVQISSLIKLSLVVFGTEDNPLKKMTSKLITDNKSYREIVDALTAKDIPLSGIEYLKLFNRMTVIMSIHHQDTINIKCDKISVDTNRTNNIVNSICDGIDNYNIIQYLSKSPRIGQCAVLTYTLYHSYIDIEIGDENIDYKFEIDRKLLDIENTEIKLETHKNLRKSFRDLIYYINDYINNERYANLEEYNETVLLYKHLEDVLKYNKKIHTYDPFIFLIDCIKIIQSCTGNTFKSLILEIKRSIYGIFVSTNMIKYIIKYWNKKVIKITNNVDLLSLDLFVHFNTAGSLSEFNILPSEILMHKTLKNDVYGSLIILSYIYIGHEEINRKIHGAFFSHGLTLL